LAVSNISTRFSTHGSMPGPGRIRRVEGMVTSPDDEFLDLRRWRSRPGWAVPTVELETAQGLQREAQEALTNARKHAPGGAARPTERDGWRVLAIAPIVISRIF